MKLFKRHKAKKSKPVKKPKPLNPNSRYGKFRKWVLQLEQRQENDKPKIPVRDTESHVCRHCGEAYTGEFCPKCSMPARWQRFNWKLLIKNFMDIWGLGSRSMFRTIRDLFWRPGYMIKDYLNGHHLSYFPPFKMLAVWSVFMLFVIMLYQAITGITPAESFKAQSIIQSLRNSELNISTTANALLEQIGQVIVYLQGHMLYRIIIQNILVVIAVKWAFSKVSNFNYVETFISQIYINSQFLIIAIVMILFSWQMPEDDGFSPYMIPLGSCIPPLVLAYDFHQLYGVTWKKALWKTVVVAFNLIILYGILLTIVGAIISLISHFTEPGYIQDVMRHHHVGLAPY